MHAGFLWGPVLCLPFMLCLLLAFPFVVLVLVLFLKIKLFGLGLSCNFLMFYDFFMLVNSLQKNKLSSSLSWFNPVCVLWVFYS